MENLTDEKLVEQAAEALNGVSGAAKAGSAQVEMMRRLKNAIEKSGKQEEKFSIAFLALALVQVMIGFIQFAYSAQTGTDKLMGAFWVILLAIIIYGIFKSFDFKKIKNPSS